MSKLILSLDGMQVTHELTEEMTTIGRAPENLIRIDDPSVSSRHVELSLVGGTCHLKDLKSTNGTLVNGAPVTSVQLHAGDRIRFGKTEAYYECDASATAQPLPRMEEAEARPAELSAKPAAFANASPFPNRKKEKDPTRRATFAAVAVALLAFLGSVIAIFMMRAPML